MIPSGIRLYTWLDVEEVLFRVQEQGENWPDWLVGARAYWDSLTLSIEPGRSEDAMEWLRDLFDPRILEPSDSLFCNLLIALESVEGKKRSLPVVLEETEDKFPPPRVVPSFSRPGVLQPGSMAALAPPPLPPESPQVFAFHSFKGGVGRTVHAVALAQAIAKKDRRVLLVDGDLEAPGISWLLETRLPNPPVSFSDLLALAHGDATPDTQESIDLVSARLRDVLLDGIYVLPAFRSLQRFHALEIRPEHLLQGQKDPFVLTNLLVAVGQRLDVDAVIVDLRAGLSELAVGLLLDSRVQRILVTTLGGQSLRGTIAVLGLLGKRAPSARDEDPLPVVITNQVPGEFRGSDWLSSTDEQLLEAAAGIMKGNEDVDILRGPTFFDSSLLALPSSWDDVLSTLRRSQISETVQPLVDLLPRKLESAALTVDSAEIQTRRAELSESSSKLIYAEKGEGEDFLPISPLRRLVMDHRQELPIAVIVGAKGAGKTYTYLQVVRRKRWRQFSQDAGESSGSIDARICPMLQPQNLSGAAFELLRVVRQAASTDLDLDAPLDSIDLRDNVRQWLGESLHEGLWRERWLDLMAWSVGFDARKHGAGRRLPEHLAQSRERIIILVDGLEDLFQNLASSEAEQRALRALLQEVPDWLSQQPSRPIGVVIFVRRDMVLNAVRQNPAQLMSRYEPYALKWDKVEALRLVAWVGAKAGALPEIAGEEIRDLDEKDLTESLIPLWGKKLGSDKSREGRSSEWVIAALSDFRGQIQARDVVRFLHLAAKGSLGVPFQWPDRILAPAAIKNAVAECSQFKIDEISQENQALGGVFGKLRGLPERMKSIPFAREEVALTAEEVKLLEENGVLVAEEGKYYMPEVFRRGLGFVLPQGARPKVLALARRKLQ